MLLVVADTGPLNYLALIGQIEILPTLFKRLFIPSVVQRELTSDRTPPLVRSWMESQPPWLDVRDADLKELELGALDPGEKAAIELALSIRADLVLIDDRKGAVAARRRGILVTGTLGILDCAAEAGLLDFQDVIRKLEQTNFRRPERVLEELLKKHPSARR